MFFFFENMYFLQIKYYLFVNISTQLLRVLKLCAILYSYLEEDHTGLRHGNKNNV